MENKRVSYGKKGRPEHGRITRMFRRNVASLLRERGFPFAAIIFNEKQISYFLGYMNGKEKGSQLPDAIICEKYIPFDELEGKICKDFIIVEVGDYVPDKWIDYPVIHIGFNKRVTPMLYMNSNFELETLKAIKEALLDDFSYSLENKSLDELRDLAMLAISGIGLTSTQINVVRWGDFIEDDDHWHLKLVEEGEEDIIKLASLTTEILQIYKDARKLNGDEITPNTSVIGNMRLNKDLSLRSLQKAFAKIYKDEDTLLG